MAIIKKSDGGRGMTGAGLEISTGLCHTSTSDLEGPGVSLLRKLPWALLTVTASLKLSINAEKYTFPPDCGTKRYLQALLSVPWVRKEPL